MLAFADVCYLIIPYLKHRDLLRLRRVTRNVRMMVDERIITQRQLKHFIVSASRSLHALGAARYLLRMLHVPNALCVSVTVEQHESLMRPIYPEPSPWSISVMTMVSYLSTPVDLRSVFHCVDVVDFENITSEQTTDLMHSKEECCCDRPLQQKRNGSFGPANVCVTEECGCLSAFFPGILDIHFRNFCRGNPEFAEVKAKKRSRPPVRTF